MQDDTCKMLSDLEYFNEERMRIGSVDSFYVSLPPHLQVIFKASMGGFGYGVRSFDNVLQGYRGPNVTESNVYKGHLGPSNGLDEVRYWFGVSKHAHWIPVIGTAYWLTSRVVQDIAWHGVYFDCKTKECVGHNKETAASKLNEIGQNLFDNGKFEEAKEYFTNAYANAKCDKYIANNRKAQAEIEAINLNTVGDNFFKEGKYNDALETYQAALNKSQVSNEQKKYSDNKNKAEIEAEAIKRNSEADELFKQGRYSEAQIKYQEAYDKSMLDIQRNKFINNRDKAQEMEADQLNMEGEIFLKKKQHKEAFAKFEQACDKFVSKESKFRSNKDIAQNRLAEDHFKKGVEFFECKNYSAAANKYEEALNTCTADQQHLQKKYISYKATCYKMQGDHATAITVFEEILEKDNSCEVAKNDIAETFNDWGNDFLKNGKFQDAIKKYNQAKGTCVKGYLHELKFEENIKHAEAEILNTEGNELYDQHKFDEAIGKYQAALKTCPDIKIESQNKYKNNIANSLNQQGLQLLSDTDFSKASDKFKVAIETCTYDFKDRRWFKNNMKTALNEEQACKVNYKGDKFFEKGKYSEALGNYQEAHDKSTVKDQLQIYSENIDKVKVELEAIELMTEGDNEFKAGRLEKAMVKYQDAEKTSQVFDNKMKFSHCVSKVKTYKSVLKEFNLIIKKDADHTELKEFAKKLEQMIEEGYSTDQEIVNRSLIISLRIARQAINTELENDEDDITDIINATMDLIETELEVLEGFKIIDKTLKQSLRLYKKQLRDINENKAGQESNYDDIIKEIMSIASVAHKMCDDVEQKASEKLAQSTHIEYAMN